MTALTELRILSWNVHHANSPLGPYSTKILDPRFLNIINDHDIFCLQETKSEVKLPNFFCLNSLRPGDTKSGGICLGFKRSISNGIKRIPGVTKSPDLIIAKLDRGFFNQDRHTYIITTYVPPSNSSSQFKRNNPNQDTLGDIQRELAALPKEAHYIICGDLNARTSNCPDFIRTDQRFDNLPVDIVGVSTPHDRNNEDKILNKQGKDLLDLCLSSNLQIANGRTVGDIFGAMTCHKWNGSSLVDYFLTSPDLSRHISKLIVREFTNMSDHAPVSLVLNLNRHAILPLHTLHDSSELEDAPQRFKWGDASPDLFLEAQNDPIIKAKILSSLSIAPSISPSDKDHAILLYESFTGILSDISFKALRKPKHRPRKPKNKWYGSDQSQLSRQCDNLADQLGKDPNSGPTRDKFFETKREYRKSCKLAKRLHLRRAIKDIEDGKNLNWKSFKRHKQELDTTTSFDNYDLVAFYSHFKNLYETKKDTSATNSSSINIPSPPQDILDATIDADEVLNTIKSLKKGKSVGFDLISNEMLQNLSPDLLLLLIKLFNACLSSGLYPWTTSLITPIPKGGDRYDPNNYRAISIGSCVGKLFSSILLARLVAFRRIYCKDPPNQLGFCKEAQCNDHIFTLRTIYEKFVIKKKTKVIACFVDFAKAFDSLARDALLHKIVTMGITGKFFDTLKNMYTNTCSRVKLINKLSKSIDHNNGVEQGHPLSPELFKMFIRDLSIFLNDCSTNHDLNFPYLADTLINHLLWADDLVLLALDEKSLQELISILGNFCEEWGLVINFKKTKVMTFTRSGRLILPKLPIKIKDVIIEATKSYTYLGIDITPNFNLKHSQDSLRKKGLKAYFGIKRVINLHDLSVKGVTTLFDALVKPVALYGAQIWADKCSLASIFKDAKELEDRISNNTPASDRELFITSSMKKISQDKLERLHLLTLKWTLGVHRKTSNLAVWGDSGRYPLAIEALQLAIDYFYRLDSLPTDSLTHLAFLDQRSLNLSWYQTMSIITSSYNNESDSSRCKMEQLFRNMWHQGISNSSKLSFYSSLKTSFCREAYLNLSNKKAREGISRLRASAHHLEIERGRYSDIPRHERLCKSCLATGIHEVEDELHMLTTCIMSSKLRSELTTKAFLSQSGLHQLFNEANQENHLQSFKRLGSYITACFDERKIALDALTLSTT